MRTHKHTIVTSAACIVDQCCKSTVHVSLAARKRRLKLEPHRPWLQLPTRALCATTHQQLCPASQCHCRTQCSQVKPSGSL